MADTPEARVKKRIREVLTTAGALYRQPTTAGYGSSGQLDFTACVNGRYLGIEAKSIKSAYGKRGPTALQWAEIDAIRKAGGFAMLVDEVNLDKLVRVVTALQADRTHVARALSELSTDIFTRVEETAGEDQPTVRRRAITKEK